MQFLERNKAQRERQGDAQGAWGDTCHLQQESQLVSTESICLVKRNVGMGHGIHPIPLNTQRWTSPAGYIQGQGLLARLRAHILQHLGSLAQVCCSQSYCCSHGGSCLDGGCCQNSLQQPPLALRNALGGKKEVFKDYHCIPINCFRCLFHSVLGKC